MEEPATSYWPKSLSCALGLVVFVAILLTSAPLLARAGTVPQQGGAVPLSQGIADLASQLAKGIPEGHTMTVAVTDFPDSMRNQTCGLGRFVAERLTTLLSQHPQCRLIERRRLDMVLSELKFSMSELVDPAKARKLGAMLGVQGLVVGSVTDLGGTVDVDARIIDIQTNVSLPGASASIVKDEAVSRMSTECGSAVGVPIEKGAPRPPLPPPSAIKSVVVEGIRFEVKSCEMSGTSVTCRVVVTNGQREDQNVLFFPGRSKMIDNSGNEYRCQRSRFGSKEEGCCDFCHSDNTLVSGTPTNLVVTYDRVPTEVTSVALIEISCMMQFNQYYFAAQLRNIPITK